MWDISEHLSLNKQSFSEFGTLLIFGISGVGKSTACKSYVARHPTVLLTSAGALLQDAMTTDSALLRTEAANRILLNQELLGSALERFRLGRESASILVEAHSVIDNDQELVEVPTDTVSAMRPDGMILLESDAATVKEQREHDTRARPTRNIEELNTHMKIAREACEKYATELRIPLEIGTVTHDVAALDALINRIATRRAID